LYEHVSTIADRRAGRGDLLKRKRTFWIVTCVAAILLYGTRTWDGLDGDKYALAHEMRQVIRANHSLEINKLSYDKNTSDFLTKLAKNSSVVVSNTRDLLDYEIISPHVVIYHYTTSVNGKTADVYLKSNMAGFHFLIPDWSITQISVDGLPVLDRFFME
jgi:hypothetical protein